METGQPSQRRIVKILIVFIIIIFVFTALYYFNLLPYKSPKQNNKPTTNIPAVNYSPNVFQYDTKQAETLLIQYIKDTIKSEFLPARIEVKQGLPINGRTQDAKKEFSSAFTAKNASLSANFHYKNNTNVPNDFVAFVQSEGANQASATAALATSLTSSYFKNSYKISDCQTKETASYCENFQTLKEGKRGYGIIFIDNPIKSLQIVFACFIPKESRGYEAQKSCIGFQ